MPFSFFLIEWRRGIFIQSSREPLWLCLCHPAMSCRKPGTVLPPPLPSPVPCCVTVWSRVVQSHWRSTAPVSLLLGFPLSPFITLPGSECWRGKNLSLGTFSPSSCQRDHGGVQTCCICPMCYQQTTNSSMDAQLCSTGTRGERSRRALRPLFSITVRTWGNFFRILQAHLGCTETSGQCGYRKEGLHCLGY